MRIIKSKTTPEDCPNKIPWIIMLGHHNQAMRNHSQTLIELHSRGGVSIQEAYAILGDRPYDFNVSEREAIDFVNSQIKERQ